MSTDLYIKPFAKSGIEVFVPANDEIDIIHNKIFSEIEIGLIKDSTRELILGYVQKLKDSHKIQALILGCTELPLMFPNDELGIPFINTTQLHIDSIIKYCINKL